MSLVCHDRLIKYMIESCPHSISRRDLSVQGMHFRQRQRLRTLEYNNKKKKKGTVRRGSWKTHHKISTFLRRVCLSSRQVRVNLKREGSVGQTVEGTFFQDVEEGSIRCRHSSVGAILGVIAP